MALPPGAIVSRFAVKRGESVSEGHLALAARKQSAATAGGEVLEWAGEGWVRGNVPSIAPGQTVTVIVAYAEWLAPRPRGDGKTLLVQYRYPMAGDAAPPLVGEFSARVDAEPSKPVSMAAGLGARVNGQAVEVRRPDFRPTADLVVDVEIDAWKGPKEGATGATARLYTAPPAGDDEAGGTVLVRTDTPVSAGSDDGRHPGAGDGHLGEHRAGALRRRARPGRGGAGRAGARAIAPWCWPRTRRCARWARPPWARWTRRAEGR